MKQFTRAAKSPLTIIALFLAIFATTSFSQVLILTHDTTNTTTQPKRLADKDSLFKQVNYFMSGYVYRTIDTNTTFADLNSFRTIIVQETSFDAIGCRWMGLPLRNAIKTWLNGGTPAAKRTLVMIGGDQSYNYDRTGSVGLDTSFSRGIGGFIYLVDNGNLTSNNGITKITGTIKDSVTTAPAGAGFWPDAMRPTNGAVAQYTHSGRGITDSLSCLSRVTTNYNVITLSEDPRYFVGTGGTPGSFVGFRRVFADLVFFVLTNGGALTGVNQTGNETPGHFSLSQNYPNPFNPVTNIKFSIPQSGNVEIKVFDILGNEVTTLVNEYKNAGFYTVDFNASRLASGTYLYRISSGNFTETKKMMLVK